MPERMSRPRCPTRRTMNGAMSISGAATTFATTSGHAPVTASGPPSTTRSRSDRLFRRALSSAVFSASASMSMPRLLERPEPAQPMRAHPTRCRCRECSQDGSWPQPLNRFDAQCRCRVVAGSKGRGIYQLKRGRRRGDSSRGKRKASNPNRSGTQQPDRTVIAPECGRYRYLGHTQGGTTNPRASRRQEEWPQVRCSPPQRPAPRGLRAVRGRRAKDPKYQYDRALNKPQITRITQIKSHFKIRVISVIRGLFNRCRRFMNCSQRFGARLLHNSCLV